MFEPEMAPARSVWARSCVLTTVLDDYFDVGGTVEELRVLLQAVRRCELSCFSNLRHQHKISLKYTICLVAHCLNFECGMSADDKVLQHNR